MSVENVDLVRRSFGQWRTGDLDTSLAALDPGVEWHMADDEPEARIVRGPEDVRSMLMSWTAAFAEFAAEPQEYIDVGDRVVVPVIFTARPHGGDGSVTIEETQVFEVRGGLIVRVDEYRTKAAALAALGA